MSIRISSLYKCNFGPDVQKCSAFFVYVVFEHFLDCLNQRQKNVEKSTNKPVFNQKCMQVPLKTTPIYGAILK